jgi:hypothetical protein
MGTKIEKSDHGSLALWAAECAERVLPRFEEKRPKDGRPRRAIEAARAWTRGEMAISEVRASAFAAHAAARAAVYAPAACAAARAAGHAAATAHVPTHAAHAVAYAAKAAAVAPDAARDGAAEEDRTSRRLRDADRRVLPETAPPSPGHPRGTPPDGDGCRPIRYSMLLGEGKGGRHLRIGAIDELPRGSVRKWLRVAADLARKKS